MNEGAYSRATDPITAYDAAQQLTVARVEMVVLERLRELRDTGATSDEMASLTGIDRVSVSPRFRPLVKKGLVEPSAERRMGRSRRPSIVWKAIPVEQLRKNH